MYSDQNSTPPNAQDPINIFILLSVHLIIPLSIPLHFDIVSVS